MRKSALLVLLPARFSIALAVAFGAFALAACGDAFTSAPEDGGASADVSAPIADSSPGPDADEDASPPANGGGGEGDSGGAIDAGSIDAGGPKAHIRCGGGKFPLIECKA